MKKTIIRIEAGLLLISLVVLLISCNKNDQPANTAQAPANTAANAQPPDATAQMAKFTDQELDELIAPVALYPDPLLAQMMPAATFVDEIIEANRTLNGKADDALIANQNWDVSVKSIAHYPPILKDMAENPDWTASIGQAYIEQPLDVNKSIQRLRYEASDAGNLVTTKQQEIIEKDNVIRIEPAEPEVIYVPQYDAETVYVEEAPAPVQSGPSTGQAIARTALMFGAGLMIGSWLNRDYDYYGQYGPPGPYYHGWNGNGWIATNQRYANVNVNRNVYVNDSYRNINVNRNVYNRNVTQYRSGVTQRAVVRDQRVTQARVNRQRQVNGGDLDRNRVNGPNQLDRNDLGERRDGVGDRQVGTTDRTVQGVDRNNVTRPGTTPSRTQSPATRQAPAQRPAPSRSAPSRPAPRRG